MRMKHIAAESMEAAMEFAREELHEDAVLLSSEPAKDGGIIVTFAIEDDDIEALIQNALEEEATPPFAVSVDTPPTQPLPQSADLAPHEYYPVPSAHQEFAPRHPLFSRDHPALDILMQSLARHPAPHWLNQKIRAFIDTHELPETSPLDAAETMLSGAIESSCRFAPIDTKAIPQNAIMLVGAHGAGKTTAIAKLATHFAINKIKPLLISTDAQRLGGSAELRSVAEILGCDLMLADTRAELKSLIKSRQGSAAILIDSAGVNIYDFSALKALGELASLEGVEPILTCQASLAAEEAQEMASVFSFLDIARGIVTRIDGSRHFSSILHLMHSQAFALANFSGSASPADALTSFSAEKLARQLLTHHRETMAS
jgi:flagellar biosynthesis GTPase FlhF